MHRRAYTLVEILIVIIIITIISVVGYRMMRSISREAVQLSKAASSSRRAEFDRFTGLLTDRLAQAWTYTITEDIIAGSRQLSLYDSTGDNYASFTVESPDNKRFTYTLIDLTTNYTVNPLTVSYLYTNSKSANFSIQTVASIGTFTNVTVCWKIPPPYYFDADNNAFRGLFLADNEDDFVEQQ